MDFYAMTPRELTILMRAQQERTADEYERMSHEAMMMRQAHHAKKLTLSDLYKRPNSGDSGGEATRIERLKESTRNTNEWLAGFTTSKGVSGKE